MTRIFVRIEFPSGTRFGPGKAALLEAVDRTGSISAAARDLDMSYRRAWLLLDSVNHLFAQPTLEAGPGGAGGGGARLTTFGRNLLNRYRRLERAADRATAADRRALERLARTARPKK